MIPKVYILWTSIRKEGAFGVMFDGDGKEFAVCLTRTFDPDNRILTPKGSYPCKQQWFIRGKHQTFEIAVPGHSEVLFHRGNVEEHSLGCILIGEQLTKLEGKDAITYSAQGFAEFWEKYKDFKEITLEVDEFKGAPNGINAAAADNA